MKIATGVNMTKDIISKKIIAYDLIGFGFVILVLWFNELIDIPHIVFGAESTPVNMTENIIETVIVFFLAVLVIMITWKLLQRIRYLEGFLPVCSFCKKIRIGATWMPIVDYISDHSEARFTHGCCPECVQEHYGHILNDESKMCT